MLGFLNKFLKKQPPLVIVAAMSRVDRAIGNKNDLLWHIPDDLRRFKQLTTGHPIIMGRKTFESILAILGKPLPKRTTIVITRDPEYHYEGVKVAHSLEEAIALAVAEHPKEVHIGGGAEIYRQALPKVSRMHITWVDDKKNADTFFPPFEDLFTIKNSHSPLEYHDLNYQWVDYQKK